MAPTLFGLESRRPAVWLAALGGGLAGLTANPLAAVAAGALATVAASGERPAAWPPTARGLARGFRVVIPGVACVAASVAGGGATAAWACLGMGLAAITDAALASPTTSAADRVSATRVSASLALTAARSSGLAGPAAAVMITAVWLAGAAFMAWWERHPVSRGWAGRTGQSLPRTGGVSIECGPLPTSGPTRRLLGLMAMAVSLAAMAGWLLLAPEHADHAIEMTLAWFVCLAVPAALLQNGEAIRLGWERVFRSAAPAGRGRLRPGLGWSFFAGRVALGHAAVLGWPALVALVVGFASPLGVRPAGLLLAALGSAAAVLIAGSLVAAWLRLRGETAFAIAAVLLVACAWGAPLVVPRPAWGEPPLPAAHFPRLGPESRC
jgi:hypothetical protein